MTEDNTMNEQTTDLSTDIPIPSEESGHENTTPTSAEDVKQDSAGSIPNTQ
jgi:hypothetical protein